MSLSLIILIGVLALIAPHIVGPILVYLKLSFPLYREFYSLSADEIASCTDADFGRCSAGVAALGFTPVENLQSISHGSKIFTTIFYNFSTLEMATVTEICSFRNENGTPTCVQFVEYASSFEDDLEVNTNNSSQLGVFHPIPERQNRSLPTVRDPADLYAIHRALTTVIATPKKPLPQGTIEEELQIEWGKTLRRQNELGYFRFEPSDSLLRPTAKGAIMMSWKLIWPVGAIRRWNDRSQSKRLTRTVLGR